MGAVAVAYIRLNISLAILLALFFLPGHSDVGQEEITLTAAVYNEHLEDIHSVLIESDCLIYDDYSNHNQVLNEALLLCKALKKGGLNFSFELVPVANQRAALLALITGKVDTAVFTFWSGDHQDALFYKSKATLKSGEFSKGLYTTSENYAALLSGEIALLNQLSVIVNSAWTTDINALSCFKKMKISSADYPLMLKHVQSGNVDAILHHFTNTDDLVLNTFGVTLQPIHNIKVVMPDTLHFFIRRNRAGSDSIIQALNKGLIELEDSDEVFKAYRSAGFFNQQLGHWHTIDCGKPGVLSKK